MTVWTLQADSSERHVVLAPVAAAAHGHGVDPPLTGRFAINRWAAFRAFRSCVEPSSQGQQNFRRFHQRHSAALAMDHPRRQTAVGQREELRGDRSVIFVQWLEQV